MELLRRRFEAEQMAQLGRAYRLRRYECGFIPHYVKRKDRLGGR